MMVVISTAFDVSISVSSTYRRLPIFANVLDYLPNFLVRFKITLFVAHMVFWDYPNFKNKTLTFYAIVLCAQGKWFSIVFKAQ